MPAMAALRTTYHFESDSKNIPPLQREDLRLHLSEALEAIFDCHFERGEGSLILV
jgi:hypothetical protein